MNNSSLEATVAWLVNRLDRGGLLRKLELSDEDLADVIWLAGQMGGFEGKAQEAETNQPESESDNVIWQDEDDQETTGDDSQSDRVIQAFTEPIIEEELKTSTNTRSLPFQAPAAPAIQNTLLITRQLRPLMKKFPSSRKRILDEEATVTRIAERGVFVPVTKPEPERWLDLELIIEQSRSSFIWQETVDELRQILEIHGAFRNVRVWNLSENKTQLQLFRRKKGKYSHQRQHSYRELIHSDGRGLVLLVSDCVSSIWQQGEIHYWLQKWSQKQPAAILQLFPERMWDSTQLGVGRKLFSSALTPGVTNPKLVLQNLPAWIPIDWQQALVLPVINLEPGILKQWSRVIAGSGKARISTYLFDLDFVTRQAKQRTNKSKLMTDAPSSLVEDINSPQEPGASIIVKRFLATASITAQRLAGMMAAAPVDMRVVNLIRKTLLPEATPVHVAEVYMGGILESEMVGELRRYQFRDGVRRLLNQAMAQYETRDVLDTISRYIAEEIDRPIRSFTALLALLPNYSRDDLEKVLPFAEVAVEVLENLGGEYAEFAAKVAANINQPAQPEPEKEDSEAEISPPPELTTHTFEIATIEIQETRPFEFTVATLERQSQPQLSGSSRENEKWEIKRQKRQGTAIIEPLEPDIDLELIEIPSGNFIMGSPEEELDSFDRERPQHQVTVSSFLMGRYPITQEQWRIVAGWPEVERTLDSDPSEFTENYEGRDRWTRPVEQVSWEDAKEFCARLSKKTKKEYRLPTEAEWEYACRAVISDPDSRASQSSVVNEELTVERWNQQYNQPFHFGETISTEIANYYGKATYGEGVKGEYRSQTTPVGYFSVANAFGLSDMHGNVLEWCEDDWHDNYGNAPTDGKAWVSGKSSSKVLRGGSWGNYPGYCRSAYRINNARGNRYIDVGFRVVCVAPRTT